MPPSAVEGSGLCPGEQGSDFRRHKRRDLNAEDKGLYQHLFFKTKHKEEEKKRTQSHQYLYCFLVGVAVTKLTAEVLTHGL